MPFLVVANFKSHKTLEEVASWVKTVALHKSIIVAPSLPHLALVHSSSPALTLCAQDVSPFPAGSYTGAVNAQQLLDLGATYCIVGHSERRHYFHESPSEIAGKVRELLDVGITPIVCLREEDIVGQRAALEDELVSRCLFCFEPEGDIGGTQTAPLEVIESVLGKIKKIYGVATAMYGGSVNADNISDLLTLGLAGVIVSTASLKPESFNAIIKQLTHVKT